MTIATTVRRAAGPLIALLLCGAAAGAETARGSDPAVAAAARLLSEYDVAPLPTIVVISPQDATRVTRGTPLGDAEAFRVTYGLARDPVVYILATSRTYRRAMACDRASLALFASVIVHEMAHGAGADERLATAAQRRFLDRVIHDPGTSLAARSILVQTRAQLDRR